MSEDSEVSEVSKVSEVSEVSDAVVSEVSDSVVSEVSEVSDSVVVSGSVVSDSVVVSDVASVVASVAAWLVVVEPSVGSEQPETKVNRTKIVRRIARQYTLHHLISTIRARSNQTMFGDDLLALLRRDAKARGVRLDDVIDSASPRLRRCLTLHVRRGGFNPTLEVLFQFFRVLGISIRGASTAKELGNLLRAHLRRLRLSERAACRTFGVNRTTLRRLLRGVPSTETQSMLEVCEKIGFKIRLGRGRFELVS